MKTFAQVEQNLASMIEAYKNIETVKFDEFHAFVTFKNSDNSIKMRKDVFQLVDKLMKL